MCIQEKLCDVRESDCLYLIFDKFNKFIIQEFDWRANRTVAMGPVSGARQIPSIVGTFQEGTFLP